HPPRVHARRGRAALAPNSGSGRRQSDRRRGDAPVVGRRRGAPPGKPPDNVLRAGRRSPLPREGVSPSRDPFARPPKNRAPVGAARPPEAVLAIPAVVPAPAIGPRRAG